MKIFDPDKYKDHTKALELIANQEKQFNGLITYAGIDYVGKISGDTSNSACYSLRDSISYRLQSVLFHYQLLAEMGISGKENSSGVANLHEIIALNTTMRQKYLFDSIVFHSVSFFDYMSCFISYIVFGDKSTQWGSIANKSRKKERFKDTELAKAVDTTHRIFVGKLNDYRGELIHYKDDNLSYGHQYNVNQKTLKINVFAPDNFLKKFKKEFNSVNNEELNINSISLWLIDVLLQESILILRKLRDYIESNRRIQAGNEVITFKNNMQ